MRSVTVTIAVVLSVSGCSLPGSGSSGLGRGGKGDDLSDAGAPDGGADPFQLLIDGKWTLPAGTETYRCVYLTLDRTIHARAFRPIAPLGTHHTVLTVGPKQHADGVFPCSAGTNYGAEVFGSGVGTNALHLPDGVAVKLKEGDQLLLNLHLFNWGDDPMTGLSGTEMIEADPAEVDTIAEAFMVSKFDLVIPPGEVTRTGACTLAEDTTLLSVAPHMHMLGTHMKVVAERASADDVVLTDGEYVFDEQLVALLPEPVEMKAGDKIRIHCSYANTTGGTVTFGDSSLEEMCISGHYRTPATGKGVYCATGP